MSKAIFPMLFGRDANIPFEKRGKIARIVGQHPINFSDCHLVLFQMLFCNVDDFIFYNGAGRLSCGYFYRVAKMSWMEVHLVCDRFYFIDFFALSRQNILQMVVHTFEEIRDNFLLPC